jgi:hypothetical protein
MTRSAFLIVVALLIPLRAVANTEIGKLPSTMSEYIGAYSFLVAAKKSECGYALPSIDLNIDPLLMAIARNDDTTYLQMRQKIDRDISTVMRSTIQDQLTTMTKRLDKNTTCGFIAGTAIATYVVSNEKLDGLLKSNQRGHAEPSAGRATQNSKPTIPHANGPKWADKADKDVRWIRIGQSGEYDADSIEVDGDTIKYRHRVRQLGLDGYTTAYEFYYMVNCRTLQYSHRNGFGEWGVPNSLDNGLGDTKEFANKNCGR